MSIKMVFDVVNSVYCFIVDTMDFNITLFLNILKINQCLFYPLVLKERLKLKSI